MKRRIGRWVAAAAVVVAAVVVVYGAPAPASRMSPPHGPSVDSGPVVKKPPAVRTR